jgi:hypothetical protein
MTGGSDSASKADAGYRGSGSGGSFAGPGVALGGAGGTAGGTTAPPPEQETKVDYLTPRGGDLRVYVANPTRNTVTIINSATLAITEQATGDTPTYVATVPGKDVALVINAGSRTLRVVRDDTPGATSYPIVSKANAIAISPDGSHAVVWFDSAQTTGSSSTTSSTGSTQEVSVVSFASGVASDSVFSVSVGYHPSAVVFSSDSSSAFVVTDDGISELRFANITSPGVAPFTRIDDGSITLASPDAGAMHARPDAGEVPDLRMAPPGDARPVLDGGATGYDAGGSFDGGEGKPDLGRETATTGADAVVLKDATPATPDTSPPVTVKGAAVDVSVTKAGDYAIARRQGSAAMLLVDLKAKGVSTLVLSSEITDLDLVDSPSGPQAFAVLRSESTLVRIDIPAGFTSAANRKRWPFSGSMIGSVTISPKGTFALLYTTAVASTDLAVFDLVNEQVLPAPEIHKTIRAVAVAPDEKTALVLHNRTTPTSTSTKLSDQDIVDQSYGYTMVQLATGFSKLQLTAADPTPFAITPDSSNAFVLLRDDKASLRITQRISLTSFITRDFPLGSPPSSIAALSPKSQKVFVGQVYAEGRISFINWTNDDIQSVTGFALNGRIQQ